MTDFDLSIVIPVYNLEKYIEECVESIFPSRYKLDVILVDDGSTDNSGAICDMLANKYPGVSVIHKSNGGASDTRNTGIKAAKAEYVAFIDGDDKVVPEAFDKIINLLDSETEVSTFNFFEYYSDEDIRPMTHLNPQLLLDNDGTISDAIFKDVSPLPMPWLYVIKREFLINNEIFMRVGLLDEDEEWTARLFAKLHSIKFFDDRFYLYRQNREGSLTNCRKIKNTLADIEIIEILESEKASGNYSFIGNKILDNKRRQMVNKVLDDLLFLTKKERQDIKRRIKPYKYLLKSGTKIDRLHYRFDWLLGRENVEIIAVKVARLKRRG